MLLRQLLAISLAALHLGCGIPRDPSRTLERVRGGTLRVGVVDNQHWSQIAGGEPTGVEARLMREFAHTLAARPEWTAGNTQELMEALKRRELDIVIGGITDSTLWGTEVGMTNSYFTNHFIIATPPGASPLREVEGVEVAVRRGEALAARLEDEGARVLRVEDPFASGKPVAAAEWEVEAREMKPTEIKLHTERHVIATPPGENRLLVALERFLFERRAQVKEMLREELRNNPESETESR